MIAYLNGEIVHKDENTCIVLVNNVGYLVRMTKQNIATLQKQVELYIYSNIKEDAFELYGFETQDDKAFFEKLISVNKVGPKTALNILELGTQKVQLAISADDVSFLKSASGLGKKGAERVILELKGKLPVLDVVPDAIPEDVFVALASLGYKRKHIESVLDHKSEHEDSVESIVKFFLQNV